VCEVIAAGLFASNLRSASGTEAFLAELMVFDGVCTNTFRISALGRVSAMLTQ